jgi:hypothetical protein
MASLTYMQRRSSGIYEFRKRLPTELAGKPAPESVRVAFPDLVNPRTGCFKGEVVRSLGTNDIRTAKRLDLRQATEMQAVIDGALALLKAAAIGKPPLPSALSAADLAEIESVTFAGLLAADEEEREDGDDRRRLQTPEERAQWPDLVPILAPWAKGMQEDHFIAYGEELAEMVAEFRQAYARHDPGIVRPETIVALKRRGVPIDRTSPGFHQAGMAVLRGTIRAYEAMLLRQEGEIIETPVAPPPAAPRVGVKLSEALAQWQEGSGAWGARRPGLGSVLEAKVVVRWFTELHGDMRLEEITKEHARQYQRALARLPKRMPDTLTGLPLPRLLQRDLSRYEARGASTINKNIAMLAAIVSHAQRGGLLDAVSGYINPFGRDMKLRVDRRTDEGREPFQPSDLAAIFGTAVFTKGERPRAAGGEAAFWFPLIALLSGMRLEEMAGLRIEDLKLDEETGTWLFDVTPRSGRSVKTGSSIRKVPAHPHKISRRGADHIRSSTSAGGSIFAIASSNGRKLTPLP